MTSRDRGRAASAACLAMSIVVFIGPRTPIVSGLAYLSMVAAAQICAALLLPALDPVARRVIAVVAAVCLVAAVAEVMLALSAWSVANGLGVATALWSLFSLIAGAIEPKLTRD